MVEVAHEALLREWPLLADWIAQRRDGFVRRDEVLRDAAEYFERDVDAVRAALPEVGDPWAS